MTITATALILFAALLHASWNAVVKSTADRLVMMTLIASATSVIAWMFIPFVPVPNRAAWPLLVASLTIHTGYMLLLVRAYRGNFGQMYPVARGVAPLLTTLLSYWLVDEVISLTGLLGILLIVAGILSLARPDESEKPLANIGYAIATGVLIAAYTVVDGVGGRLAGNSLSYIVYMFALHGIPLTAITLLLRGRSLMVTPKVIGLGIAGAIMSMLAYGIVIWAMSSSPLGPVAALRETSVIFAAMISVWLLKEDGGRKVIIVAVLVTMGVVLLKV
jgi:drug/metabolite transporter (DMT)-like permease